MSLAPDLTTYRQRLATANLWRRGGKVTRVTGLTIEARGLKAAVGELCYIYNNGAAPIVAEVVGFREEVTLLMPLGELEGIGPGCRVMAAGHGHLIPVGRGLMGRVLDGLGRPLDGRPLVGSDLQPVNNPPPHPLARRRIKEILATGIKAIDALLTCGCGQRVGIFAGSGVGKSTLLGMIARHSTADINVIALIGERGREVRDFIEGDLGPEGLSRSVVVVATSDQPALVRIKGAFTATAIAEYFRDQGQNVLLMMDSLTRFAIAQREVGLAIGEPPATRGYTPSVFASLPRLVERAGNGAKGSITGLYTVLVEGDDMNEPVADTVRGLLDGHIVLSRKLAARNHYPAIDVLQSISRLMPEITSREQQAKAGYLRDLLAAYQEAADLIEIGAYQQGSNPQVDAALKYYDAIQAFLRQGMDEYCDFDDTLAALTAIFS
ncbi:ATPase, type III secretion system,H+-transporting [Moorella glycerini]|uniref:Type 3 secretion system ATPase n=1 Tax=Neomoorella stamsii TaxID=1266720 RepID=A0A9X7J251_9FIRM|nr:MULTISPECIES: flagellar protein export ATPase FliI [Moorella]PRR72290.1 putative ATP synthase YscN [Moorella stamsii]CEP68899.1 ATPase, type III secretion system,H+-transporting [Moorella glycerini]CEP69591.1 ATPase, type III secretion system,H+-transporting [Moorella glycerini]